MSGELLSTYIQSLEIAYLKNTTRANVSGIFEIWNKNQICNNE